VDRIVAVVGAEPILYSQLLEELLMRRASGVQVPTDSAALRAFERQVLDELVDGEVLVQKAKAEKVEVSDEDLEKTVDDQVKQIRARFQSDAEFRAELRKSGFGTPDDYRRRQLEILRRRELQREVVQKLRRDGKLSAQPVSDQEVSAAFEEGRENMPKREAMVSLKQIVVSPKPSDAAKKAARAKAESLLVEIQKGGDFEQIAKRESMDPGSKELGGDLGWNRRGNMVKEFDAMMFALAPGRVSPIVETVYGYHLIRVDRVQPAEVKARHILIRPVVDSADARRAQLEADSVARAVRAGTSIDSLVGRHHDKNEYSSLPDVPRSQLPEPYGAPLANVAAGQVVGPFPIPDRASGLSKFVVVQVLSAQEGGDYTLEGVRARLREQLSEAKMYRRLIDNLRKQTFVTVRI
jgi:peptidyl-prolyl cis-trans isomerase SurA